MLVPLGKEEVGIVSGRGDSSGPVVNCRQLTPEFAISVPYLFQFEEMAVEQALRRIGKARRPVSTCNNGGRDEMDHCKTGVILWR